MLIAKIKLEENKRNVKTCSNLFLFTTFSIKQSIFASNLMVQRFHLKHYLIFNKELPKHVTKESLWFHFTLFLAKLISCKQNFYWSDSISKKKIKKTKRTLNLTPKNWEFDWARLQFCTCSLCMPSRRFRNSYLLNSIVLLL